MQNVKKSTYSRFESRGEGLTFRDKCAIAVAGGRLAFIPQASDRAIRMDELKQLIGLSKTTIYTMIERGEFSAGFLISKRARAWMLSTVTQWLEERKQGGAA